MGAVVRVALVPRLRRRWAKVLAALYPVATVTSIVVSATTTCSAVAGFLALGLGYVLARVHAQHAASRCPTISRSGPSRRSRPRSR